MILEQFNQESAAAGSRYLILIQGFRNAYTQAFSSAVMKSSAIDGLTGQLYDTARIYLGNEQVEIQRASDKVAFKARQSAFSDLSVNDSVESDNATSELLRASRQHLSDEIAVQLERDIAFTKQQLRRARLQIGISARTQGVDHHTARMQHIAAGRNELRYNFMDRGGRKWPSQKFVSQVWRQHLLNTYNDAYLATAAEFGVDQFRIDHPDAERLGGLRFTTTPGGSLPTYDEIKDQVFHPNSVTVVRMVSQL